MKLSFLIPTHNRPDLFSRCIQAILPQLTPDMEIIVNNDSCDITEISHPQVTYYYQKFEHLSTVYKFLLEKASGEYVYFAEDDDYVVKDFATIKLEADLIAGNYYPTYGQSNTIPCMTLYKNALYSNSDVFIAVTNLYHLQLSQYIFKRSCIANFDFPHDSNVHNDIKLMTHAVKHSKSIQTLNKVFYHQTIDGKDNISFEEFTTQVNTL